MRTVLAKHGASLETCWGGLTVHHIDDLGFDARDPQQMPWYKGEFQRAAKKRPIRPVVPVPSPLRPPPDADAADLATLAPFGQEGVAAAFAQAAAAPPPDDRRTFTWVGGETAALEHLDWYMRSGQLSTYRGATESFAHGEANPVNSGTRLSPWLAFGCVSARHVVHEARRYERAHGKSSSTGKGHGKSGSTGARLHTELLFRDFLRFSALSWGTSLFKVNGPFRVEGLEWGRDAERFAQWRAGQTGFPFVDAGMRELAATGYLSHLHRQCCAAFLVRDLRLDWRMGAEHFEACLLDHTPDANWGNWAYRILQRPCLAASRAQYPVEAHITTVECLAWPVVHDARMAHTLRWVPELRGLPRDLAREPWRTETEPERRLAVRPYKDSPLWFCAANRTNWDYEYFWLPGHAWTVRAARGTRRGAVGFELGRDYPRPMVPPLNVEIDLDKLPLAPRAHEWGDTEPEERPHVWGTPGRPETPAERQVEPVDAGNVQTSARGGAGGCGKGKGQGRGSGGSESRRGGPKRPRATARLQ